ncbi:MAG: DNA polymerase IV [Burkholderiaceae bacterium]|nr:DNA polymerase IV [Burkholderiaceae bacterium]
MPTPATPRRRIAHLDMDAFYASVELLRHPELRGQPVAIGGHGEPSRRGVVTTATYEARAFGIRSGMALRRAAELCPQCVFLPVDFDEYRRHSRRFKAAIATVTDRIEDRGIDEVYIDLTAVQGIRVDRGAPVARDIQRRVLEATGLSCSIGLAPNKLLAKIASDLHKPGGVTIVDEEDIAATIWPLPARRINGVGPKAELQLEDLGLRTIGDLAAAPLSMLVARFGGNYGRWLHEAANGRDDRPIVTASEPVSMSRETTFERDLHPHRDWQALAACLAELCREVAADLRRRGYAGRTIGVKARYDDFRIVTRDQTLPGATDDAATIRRAAFECLGRVPATRRLRLLGVRVAGLARTGAGTEPRRGAAGAADAGHAASASAAAPAPPAGAQQPELPLSGEDRPLAL